MKKLALYATLSLGLLAACDQNKLPDPAQNGQQAMTHLAALEAMGPRLQGTPAEVKAQDYVQQQLQAMGYEAEEQPFQIRRVNNKGTGEVQLIPSSNVTALKLGRDQSREIIVVAHVDSVRRGKGADDNASGVSVLLEAAQAIRNVETPTNVRFLVVGAEERDSDADFDNASAYSFTEHDGWGLQGSHAYVQEQVRTAASKEAFLKRTAMIVNLDSLIAGDKMNVYGNPELVKAVQARGQQRGYTLDTNPAAYEYEGEQIGQGHAGYWSDHAAFKATGIPYIYFESTNLALGDYGLTQTEKHGAIWHTENDNLEFLQREFPGRALERVRGYSTLLQDVLINPPVR